MKKLSLLTTFALLGASSMAFADPTPAPPPPPSDGSITVRDHRNDDRYDDRYDNRYDDRYDDNDRDGRIMVDRDHYQPRWISLGTAGPGKTGIAVGDELGRFQSLRLDVDGWMRIRQVVVLFEDGTQQKVRMSGSMSRKSAPLVIDLSGSKRIARVIVYAGQFGRGTINVSGLEAKKIFWRRHRDQADSYDSYR